jgi:hypothetical protein
MLIVVLRMKVGIRIRTDHLLYNHDMRRTIKENLDISSMDQLIWVSDLISLRIQVAHIVLLQPGVTFKWTKNIFLIVDRIMNK